MKNILSKFKFKWWSWEIDSVELFPFLILFLAKAGIVKAKNYEDLKIKAKNRSIREEAL